MPPPKTATVAAWVWATTETVAVIALVVAGSWYSGVPTRRRSASAAAPAAAEAEPVQV
ncbi:hypothetical protein [Streptomyces sp. NPDC006333]|uniref:hypothetical protein n=1 Tax=Streptomyces sp. NPDC006333 TaxID=3156753 RepID=UPI0033B73C6B